MKLQLSREREKRKWNQEYVSEKVGITTEAISMLETGRRKPSFDVLIKLLELFEKKEALKQIRQLFAPAGEAPISQENDTTK